MEQKNVPATRKQNRSDLFHSIAMEQGMQWSNVALHT